MYCIELRQEGKPAQVERHSELGICGAEGTCNAQLIVSHSYSRCYAQVMVQWPDQEEPVSFNIDQLDGRKASETIPILLQVTQQLGAEKYDGPCYTWAFDRKLNAKLFREFNAAVKEGEDITDPQHEALFKKLMEKDCLTTMESYNKPTDGNAGYAASVLHKWALQYPDAIWSV